MVEFALRKFYVWIRGIHGLYEKVDGLEGNRVINAFLDQASRFSDYNLDLCSEDAERLRISESLYFRKEVYTMKQKQMEVDNKYADFKRDYRIF